MSMPPTTAADMRAACQRVGISYESLAEAIHDAQCRRLIDENQAEQAALCEVSTRLAGVAESHAEFMRAQNRLTVLFARHSELMREAYPSAHGAHDSEDA